MYSRRISLLRLSLQCMHHYQIKKMHLRAIYYQQRAETNKSLLLYQQNFYLFFCYVNISNEVFLTGYFRSRYRKNVKTAFLKVSKFQNEFMKSSFLPKYEPKIVRISALYCAHILGETMTS